MRDSYGEPALLIICDRDDGSRITIPILRWGNKEIRLTKSPHIPKRRPHHAGMVGRRYWLFKIGHYGLTLDRWHTP